MIQHYKNSYVDLLAHTLHTSLAAANVWYAPKQHDNVGRLIANTSIYLHLH